MRMPENTIALGMRRLYKTVGISLEDEFERGVRLANGAIVVMYLGPEPKLGRAIRFQGTDRFYGASERSNFGSLSEDIPNENEPGLYFDTLVGLPQQISPEKFRKLTIKPISEQIRNEFLDLSEQDAETLRAALDCCSGLIGLRIHRQIVLDLIIEQPILVAGNETSFRTHSGVVEGIEPKTITADGKVQINAILDSLCNSNFEQVVNTGQVLWWLERAWRETDEIAKFLALFIPLECILAGIKLPKNNEWNDDTKKIRSILAAAGYGRNTQLRTTFDNMASGKRPSLDDRFAVLARESKEPGWELDVEAFKNFNKMRNDLLHAGKNAVSFVMSDSKEVLHSLEDIAERYISFAVFRDTRVYTSGFRPVRKTC